MFINARFPLALSTGATVILEHQVFITRMDSGFESRQARWSTPLRRYTIRTARDLSEVETLRRFWTACKGPFHSFRFRDITEYTSSAFAADAVVPNAVTALDQNIGTGDGTTTTFQLRKQYVIDNEDGASPLVQWTTNRTITKPVSGTVLIAVNGITQTEGGSPDDYTVDYATGIVTFSTPPALGLAVTAGFEFDVHVRFDAQMVSSQFVSTYEMESSDVQLLEVRNA